MIQTQRSSKLISRLFILFLITSLSVLFSCAEPKNSKPNLVIISIDTARADHLGIYGYEYAQTPNIDALSKEGFLFAKHMTPVPITLPSHTSILTGQYPPTHTVHDNGVFNVPEDAVTLAETLKGQGYSTAAFVGAFPMSARFDIDQGFDVFDDDFLGKYKEAGYPKPEKKGIHFDERPAEDVIQAAINHHDRKSDSPFFTFIHVFDPHQPLQPPPPYDLIFRQRPYDGEIAYVDEQLGRFFAYLKDRGLWDNTIVVVTADHGEGLGEHGEMTHALLLHQATLHVPLIMKGPKVPVGKTDAWTMSTQIFATVLELLGVDLPKTDHPVSPSLLPLMNNDGKPPADWPEFRAFFETIAPRTGHGWSQLTGWMEGDWRLVHGPKSELYHLGQDPKELDNQYKTQQQIGSEMLGNMKMFLSQAQTKSVGESFTQVDQGTAERLAALGYVQHDGEDMSGFDDLLDVSGRIDPKDRVVDVGLSSESRAALNGGNWQQAYTLLNEMVRRNPMFSDGYRGLAILYGQIGENEKCLENIDRAIALSPKDKELARLKGEALIEMGKPDEGIEILLALKQPEKSMELCTWIGSAYIKMGKSDLALEWFKKGLLLDPKNPWLHLYVANELAKQRKVKAAEEHYRKIIEISPYFSLAYYNYGKLLVDYGYLERAKELLKRAIQLAPSHYRARVLLNQVNKKLKEKHHSSKENIK